MERFGVHEFCDIARRLASGAAKLESVALDEKWEEKICRDLAVVFSEIIVECEKVSMHFTVAAITRLCEHLKGDDVKTRDVTQALAEIQNRFYDELRVGAFFWVPARRADMYDGPRERWSVCLNAFPSIAFDADEAAKCMCLGRFTASASHLMRTLEVAIGAISKKLGITKHSPTWNAYLAAMEAAANAKYAGHGRNKRLRDYFAALRAQLSAIKDAYRNPTMHAIERTYTEEELQGLFILVGGFLVEAAKEVKE